MPPTAMFARWAPQPWFDTSVKVRVLCSCGCKEQPIFFYFSLTEDAFSEGLKQESSKLETGDIANEFLDTTGKDTYGAYPLVLSFLEMPVHLSGTQAILGLFVMRSLCPELIFF